MIGIIIYKTGKKCGMRNIIHPQYIVKKDMLNVILKINKYFF